MKDFIQHVQNYSNDPLTGIDPSAEDWAVRAFSVIAAMGNHDDVTDEVGQYFAQLLAKAPDEVVAMGTFMVMMGMAITQQGEGE